MAKKFLVFLMAAMMLLSMTHVLASEMTLVDSTQREVTLPGPAERIVVLTPSDCEILYALGAGDKVVGRGEYCNYPEAVNAVEMVKSGQDMNLEQVIALKPDVVVAGKMNHTKEQMEALEKAGIKTVVTDAVNLEGVYAVIDLMGKLTDKGQEAEQMIAKMKGAFEDVVKKVAGRTAGTVYYEVSPLQYGLWAAGGDTFMNELGNMVGLTNVFADQPAWAQVSEEQVIKADPDYIVTTTMYFGEGPTPLEEINARNGWQEMKALTNKNVLNADNDEITRPGPRLVEAIEGLYQFIYEREAEADKAA